MLYKQFYVKKKRKKKNEKKKKIKVKKERSEQDSNLLRSIHLPSSHTRNYEVQGKLKFFKTI